MGRAQQVTDMQEQSDLPITENVDGSAAVTLPDDHPEDDISVTEEKRVDPPRDDDSQTETEEAEGEDNDDEGASEGADDSKETEARLEARREKRKEERHRRTDRERRAKESDKIKIAALEKQVNELAGHVARTRDLESSFKLTQADKKIDDLSTQVEYAKIKLTDAIQAGDAVKQAELLDILTDIKTDLRTAKSMKDEQIKSVKQAPDKVSNVGRNQQEKNRLAMRWMNNQEWFDPQMRDMDSQIVKLLDDEIGNEGYLQPHTQEYWDELTLRCEERLPHQFERGKRMKKTPVTSSRSEAAVAPTIKSKREFYLSPARKQAIVDAGYWDDAAKKQKLIRSYMEFDRLNKKE